MNNLDIGKTLRKLRHQKMMRLHDVEVALSGALDFNAISRMEKVNKTVSIPKLQLLANIYGVTVTEIFRDAEGIKEIDIGMSQMLRVPIISWVEAGGWADSPPSIDAIEDCKSTIAPLTAGPNGYGLKVNGDSMTSTTGMSFPNESVIIVNPDKTPKNSDYVIAYFEDTGESTFKQLLIDGPSIILNPLNPLFPPIQNAGNISIKGVVVHMQWDEKI